MYQCFRKIVPAKSPKKYQSRLLQRPNLMDKLKARNPWGNVLWLSSKQVKVQLCKSLQSHSKLLLRMSMTILLTISVLILEFLLWQTRLAWAPKNLALYPSQRKCRDRGKRSTSPFSESSFAILFITNNLELHIYLQRNNTTYETNVTSYIKAAVSTYFSTASVFTGRSNFDLVTFFLYKEKIIEPMKKIIKQYIDSYEALTQILLCEWHRRWQLPSRSPTDTITFLSKM